MPVLVVGVNHHHLVAETIAQLAAAEQRVRAALAAAPQVDGHVLLATCNRFEVYLDGPTFHGPVDATITALRTVTSEPDTVVGAVEIHAGESAAEHLFSVACGLDSMVVGEAQIVGQVRQALATAGSAATPRLHRLFQDALATAKAVKSTTGLGAAGRTIASVGLDLVETRHGALAGRRVLVLGTGDYAGIVVAELARRGCTSLEVHSRTDRADDFARRHDLSAVPEDGLETALARADVVVVCSRPGSPVLTPALVADARARARAVLPVLDLSAGGIVAEGTADLVHVDVLGLDEIGEHAPDEQATAILQAGQLVERAVAAYLHVEEGRTAAPAVTAMRAHVSQIIAREAELATRRHSPEVADAIGRALARVSNSLLHTPSVRAAELARTGGLEDYERAMHTLFGITVESR